MKHDVTLHQTHMPSQAGFLQRITSLLTPVREARHGDVVGIGIPMTLNENDDIVFDWRHPIPEVAICQNGEISLASDDHLHRFEISELLNFFKQVRRDLSIVDGCCTVARELVHDLPRDGSHRGILGWQYHGFALACAWSHTTRHVPVTEIDPVTGSSTPDADYLPELTRYLISKANFTRSTLMTRRRI